MKNVMMMVAASALVLGSASAFASGAAASKPLAGVKTASAPAMSQDNAKSKKHGKKKDVKSEAETVKQ